MNIYEPASISHIKVVHMADGILSAYVKISDYTYFARFSNDVESINEMQTDKA